MNPLGQNRGAYHGERTEIAALLREIRRVAPSAGWREEVLLPGTDREIVCFTRSHRVRGIREPVRLYVSAGMHGDEPAGPAALMRMFRLDLWPDTADLWVCPCLNPTGCAQTTRENDAGVDLNRDYRDPVTAEVRAHIEWLARQPSFHGVVCLHEDWESGGFYCYELNPPGSATVAEAVVEAVREVCPIENAEVIDGRPATAPGIIRPNLDPAGRPEWPEAFWMWHRSQGCSLTLEAPSDFPLPVRVQALVTATCKALERWSA